MSKPLVDKEYLLEKFPGKGGWTYAAIPEVLKNEHTPFGWVRVRGSIDGFPFEKSKLQPMGNGKLFFPVKAAIRKKIGKESGDTVHIILYEDTVSEHILEELRLCFEHEPKAISAAFEQLDEFTINAYIGWIHDAKSDNEKAARIAELIRKLESGQPL